jgi:hypothetical protein
MGQYGHNFFRNNMLGGYRNKSEIRERKRLGQPKSPRLAWMSRYLAWGTLTTEVRGIDYCRIIIKIIITP